LLKFPKYGFDIILRVVILFIIPLIFRYAYISTIFEGYVSLVYSVISTFIGYKILEFIFVRIKRWYTVRNHPILYHDDLEIERSYRENQ
jgi:hypothetical protein